MHRQGTLKQMFIFSKIYTLLICRVTNQTIGRGEIALYGSVVFTNTNATPCVVVEQTLRCVRNTL